MIASLTSDAKLVVIARAEREYKGKNMNLWDIIIIVIVVLLVVAAIALLRRRKKTGCSCGCEGCQQSCRKRQQQDRN